MNGTPYENGTNYSSAIDADDELTHVSPQMITKPMASTSKPKGKTQTLKSKSKTQPKPSNTLVQDDGAIAGPSGVSEISNVELPEVTSSRLDASTTSTSGHKEAEPVDAIPKLAKKVNTKSKKVAKVTSSTSTATSDTHGNDHSFDMNQILYI